MRKTARTRWFILALAATGLCAGTVAAQGTPPNAKQPQSPAAAETIPVRFNPKVELLSIVFRLAGNPEYNMESSASPYAEEVRLYFRDFAGHEAVKLAREYRKNFGVSHDAVMSYAVHLSDDSPLTAIKPKILFDFNPERLDKRWNAARANRFLEALNKFVADSKADKFIADHEALYQKAATRLAEPLSKKPYRAWLDSFFGARPGAVFVAAPGVLNGGANYGVGVLYADGHEDITPVFGAGRFDKDGVPLYDDSVCSTIVHEFCHTYTNPLVDKAWKDLSPSFEKLFPLRSQFMQQQSYGNPKAMAYESLVRACTVRYTVEKEGKQAAAAQLADEHARGFLWTGELVDLLGVYQLQRDKYPTLAEFMPEITAFFQKVAENPQNQLKKLPRIVKSIPAANTAGADPSISEITIEFDRPMLTGSYSFVGDQSQMPKLTGTPWFGTDAKTITLPVKLEPGKRYVLRLNSLQHHGFAGADGFALDPVEISFGTKR